MALSSLFKINFLKTEDKTESGTEEKRYVEY